jgi:hypothetical protein
MDRGELALRRDFKNRAPEIRDQIEGLRYRRIAIKPCTDNPDIAEENKAPCLQPFACC